jgi:hypothetical protein
VRQPVEGQDAVAQQENPDQDQNGHLFSFFRDDAI